MAQYGFFVDTTRCIKCWSCVIACKQWHGIQAGTISRRNVEETNTGEFPAVTRTFTSTSCMHCATPACADVCPTDSITKREEDGIVVVDIETCINCQSCLAACPFGVPEYTDVMDKCDACISLDRQMDEEPKCVSTCPTRALHFGDLDEMGVLAAEKGGSLMEGETGPSVYIATRH